MIGRRSWRHPVRWSAASALLAVFVSLILIEAGLFAVTQRRPALNVSVATEVSGPRTTVTFSLGAGPLPIGVHLAVLPGTAEPLRDPAVLYFADPAYPSLYASPADVYGMGVRIGTYFPLMGSHDYIVFVNSEDLPAMLARHPYGTLVIAGGGVIPDYVYSPISSLLRSWVEGGGTLVWAGGPLAYSSGHVSKATGQFVYNSLQWAGQTDLLGFPLCDPVDLASINGTSSLTLSASEPSPLGAALGIGYQGTPAGANTSEVIAHGGTVLGYATPSSGGAASRTSLAYLPLGSGAVYYFGGAIFQGGLGYVPQASVNLTLDIALLLTLNYRPTLGPSAFANIGLGPLQSRSVALTVNGSSGGLIAFVRSALQGGLEYFWSGTLDPPVPLAVARGSPSEVG